jgi:hypothetical protein
MNSSLPISSLVASHRNSPSRIAAKQKPLLVSSAANAQQSELS